MSSQDAASVEEPQKPQGNLPFTDSISPDLVRSLYETHAAELFMFLIGVLRNTHDATEVSQTTFHRLLEVGQMVRGETQKGWLFRVALREALILKRKAALRDRHLKSYSIGRQSAPLVPSAAATSIETEELVRLKQLLTQLPPDQQRVVRERIYEEKSFATIAAELNVPLGTVLKRMHLALTKLRKWWEDE